MTSILGSLLVIIILIGRFIPFHPEDLHGSARVQMSALANGLKDHRRTCGFYPLTEQGLEGLIRNTLKSVCHHFPRKGFVDADVIPLNPWGGEFIYSSDGRAFELHTFDNQGNKLTFEEERSPSNP